MVADDLFVKPGQRGKGISKNLFNRYSNYVLNPVAVE